MKERIKSIWLPIGAALLLAVICLIVFLVGRAAEPEDKEATTEPSSTTTPLSAEEQYAQAISAVSNTQNMILTITIDAKSTIGNETFTESSRQVLFYKGLGTDDFQAKMSEELKIGDYTVSNTEIFANNTGYFTVGDSHFYGELTADAYFSRYTPAVLLDASLYRSITSEGDTIIFSDPTAAESWAVSKSAVLLTASGSATVDDEQRLKESTYTFSCKQDNITLEKTVHIFINYTSPTFSIPDPSGYAAVDCLDAPIMLEKAAGYLLQADSVTAHSTDSIICEAFGDERTQTVALDMCSDASGFLAKIDMTVSLVNYSHGADAVQKTQSILFQDGTCFVTADNESTSTDVNATSESMRTYCQDLLIGSILLPEYISTATATDLSDAYRYEFIVNEEMAQLLAENACQTLYQNPDLASSFTTAVMTAYLTVDKQTGLPTASGICYNGTYATGDMPYLLCYQTDQLYKLASQTAYHTITGS